MANIALTEAQVKLLNFVATEMELNITVTGDWEKLANVAGYTSVASCRARWNEVVRKLKPNATASTPTKRTPKKTKELELSSFGTSTSTASKGKATATKRSKPHDDALDDAMSAAKRAKTTTKKATNKAAVKTEDQGEDSN